VKLPGAGENVGVAATGRLIVYLLEEAALLL
jgi:hypothetical protein